MPLLCSTAALEYCQAAFFTLPSALHDQFMPCPASSSLLMALFTRASLLLPQAIRPEVQDHFQGSASKCCNVLDMWLPP